MSAAVCHAAKFAVMAHAGTDRRTDPAVHTRWAVPTNRHSILQVFLIIFSLITVKKLSGGVLAWLFVWSDV